MTKDVMLHHWLPIQKWYENTQKSESRDYSKFILTLKA